MRSDNVIISSPLSITGGCKRYLRATHTRRTWATIVAFVPRWLVFTVLLAFLLVWNVIVWGFFWWTTLAWRAYRNSRRRDKRQQAQHHELLAELSRRGQ